MREYDPAKFPWASHEHAGISAPAFALSSTTLSDSGDNYARSLRIVVPASLADGGTVRVEPFQNADGQTVDLTFPAPGVYWEPIAVRKVYSAGTTVGITVLRVTK